MEWARLHPEHAANSLQRRRREGKRKEKAKGKKKEESDSRSKADAGLGLSSGALPMAAFFFNRASFLALRSAFCSARVGLAPSFFTTGSDLTATRPSSRSRLRCRSCDRDRERRRSRERERERRRLRSRERERDRERFLSRLLPPIPNTHKQKKKKHVFTHRLRPPESRPNVSPNTSGSASFPLVAA